MVNDPLGFGNLPTQQMGPGGVVVQPVPKITFAETPYYIAAPTQPSAPPPDRAQPVWAVEDRRSYWEAQKERANAEIFAEQQRVNSFMQGEQIPTLDQNAVKFGQGIMQSIPEYERGAILNAATSSPQARQAYQENVVRPLSPGEPDESYFQPGYIQTSNQAAQHELTHGVWYQQMSGEQRAEFIATVMALAEEDPFVKQVIEGRRDAVIGGSAGVDPQHIYTYFSELAPSAVPPELKKFYDAAYIRRGQLDSALRSTEFKEKLTGAIEIGSGIARAGAGEADKKRREEDALINRRRNQPTAAQSPEELAAFRQRTARLDTTGTPLDSPLFDKYPGSDTAQRIAGEVGQRVGRTALGLTGPVGQALESYTPVGDIAGKIGEEAAQLITPRVYADLALELIPGIGSLPFDELVTRGTRLAKTPEGRAALSRLARAGERGALEPEKVVPDAVKAIVTRKQRNMRGVVSRTEDDLQKRWEVLPVENQKLIATIADSIIPDAERAALLSASRGKKAQSIREIMQGEGTADEKLNAAWAARSGADLPDQQALREFFDDSDIASYKAQIVDAYRSKMLQEHEATNAGAILDFLMDGVRKNGKHTPLQPWERKLMGKVFGPELELVLPTTMKEMSLLQKFLAPMQLWRSMKTAFDVGAMFRQGRKVIISDPVEWLKASRGQFRGMGQKGYERLMHGIRNSKYYTLGQSQVRPLGILEQGGGQADEFLSPVTQKIPGLNVSERVYNGFLNILRQGIFEKNIDELLHTYNSLDQIPEGEIQRIIDNINTATMFGNISKMGEYSKVLGQTLFSVRSLVSAPQFYGDFVRAMGPNASPAARKIIARRFASVIASDIATLGAVAYLGAWLKENGSPVNVSVNLDHNSQTFGDARIGPVKWNPWGPEAQMVRAIVQAATGKQRPEGASEARDINPFQRATQFARTKLSPQAAILYDLFLNQQRDFRGRPIKDRAWEYAVEQAAPIIGWSMYDAFRDEGFWGTTEILQGVGLDVQTYGTSETTKKANEKTKGVTALEESGIPFSGKEIDFTKPLLDYGNNRQAIARQLGLTDVGDESLTEMKEAYVEAGYAPLMERDGISEARARDMLSDYFDTIPDVKAIKDRAEDDIKAYWQAHPEDLKAALDANLTDRADYKDEILEKAEIR